MIPVYNSTNIREWDQFTISKSYHSSAELMDHVAQKILIWLLSKFDSRNSFLVFCGNGNNGGDGLAIANLLITKKFKVQVAIINLRPTPSSDFKLNYEKLMGNGYTGWVTASEALNIILQDPGIIILDSILGSGINKPPDGETLNIIQEINKLKNIKISIDLPSGMFPDHMTWNEFVKADYTLSLQCPKLCQLIPDTGQSSGVLEIIDINLDNEFKITHPSSKNFLEIMDIKNFFKYRNEFAYKNKFGHILIQAGSYEMAGAALLCAEAAMKSGCGLCSLSSVEENRDLALCRLPEIIFVNPNQIEYKKYSSVVVGPGLGISHYSKSVLINALENNLNPIVLDADALKILVLENLLKKLPAGSILTPHVGEFDYLFGASMNGFDRLDKAISEAEKWNIFIVLKGKYTAIITPKNKIYFNSTGNVGLAKGGSGDILCGMIGSFLAQGYTSEQACILGVYLHGKAADIAEVSISVESMMPEDILNNISKSFQDIKL